MNCSGVILSIDCGWANIGFAVIDNLKTTKVGLMSSKSFVKHHEEFEKLLSELLLF
jgi:RNase H-fold protein (predicted Holliday junction resolvase)